MIYSLPSDLEIVVSRLCQVRVSGESVILFKASWGKIRDAAGRDDSSIVGVQLEDIGAELDAWYRMRIKIGCSDSCDAGHRLSL